MNITILRRVLAGLAVLMLSVMGLTISSALQIHENGISSEQHRLHSLRLAVELLQSSEDLTRMARSYVATGNPEYERRYVEILDIRNGKSPRPHDYPLTYWHLAGAGKAPPLALDAAVPLQELMRREGFSDVEFGLLRQSQANSDQLVALERQAFAAIKGWFDNGRGEFVVARKPDRAFATTLLYGEEYIDAKARIMAPIQQFIDAIEDRTNTELMAIQSALQRRIVLLMALVVAALLCVFAVILYTRRVVLQPMQKLGRHAQALAEGNYAVRCEVNSTNELGVLSANFNRMAEAIENDIAERMRVEQSLAQTHEELAARESMLKQILDTSSVGILLVDMQGRITHANHRMAEMFGWPIKSLVGMEYVALIHPSEQEAGRQKMLALLASQINAVDLERRYWHADRAEFWGHLTGRSLYDAHGVKCGLVGAISDITERKNAERREQHHKRVLELLAQHTPLMSVLDIIARDIDAMNPDMLSSILLLDNEGTHLRHGAAPGLPDFYNEAINGVAIGPEVGSCGAASFTGERVIVADIDTHPSWVAYRDLARRAGLRACWSQPVLSSEGRVLGSFALYHREPRQPSLAELNLIAEEASLVQLVIENAVAETRLQLAASVFTHAREGIMITDAKGIIVDVNETFSRITGYGRSDAVGKNPRMLNSGRQPPEYYAAMWQSLAENGHWSGEVWNRRKNGEVYAEILTISAVRDAAGKTQNYVALFTDITTLKAHQQQLEHIAHYDALTGLPNRVLLSDRLQQATARNQRSGQSVAVVFLDLDGFKAVNDSHGHAVGDELLVVVSQRMKTALREGDTLARMGGDEFVAVLIDLDQPEDCEPVLDRLLLAASDAVVVDHQTLYVSASIGVTLYPQDGADPDQLMRHADQAMYQAKQAGKNRYHLFDVAHDASVKTQRESLDHIRRALAENEFVLYYQPKVNMRTGEVIGVEALIRWQHPEFGFLAPNLFLPVIENHPLSIALGEWVIAAALAQIAAWREAGLDMPVSVNVDARQVQQDGFVQGLEQMLAAHPDMRLHRLELELLETNALEDIARVAEVMRACRVLGVDFALDDFGTGYSSLTYLRRLPARLLKIDQSFVRDMLDDPEDMAIVDGVIGLATAFRRQVIAEGVETIAHGACLLPRGCELAQGYGIARPMPAAKIPGWVADWQPDATWLQSS